MIAGEGGVAPPHRAVRAALLAEAGRSLLDVRVEIAPIVAPAAQA